MKGKLCIVTGATSGIGQVAARELAARGARLVLVCRSRARGERTQEAIRSAVDGAQLELRIADLALQKDIRAVATEILADHPRIDVLLNNAGVVNLGRKLTVDGIEETFAVNHLGHFLLTLLLLERMKESAPARIVNVASEAHRFVGGIDFDDLEYASSYGWIKAYGSSKLANILFTYELSRRLEGSGVTVNCLHPGMVATNLGANHGWISKLILLLVRPFARTPERGAETSIYLASSAEVEGRSGGYFVDRRERRSADASYDREAARRLWEVSEELVGIDRPIPSV